MALTKVAISDDSWKQLAARGINYSNFREKVGLKIRLREFRGGRKSELYVLCDSPMRAVEFKLKWL